MAEDALELLTQLLEFRMCTVVSSLCGAGLCACEASSLPTELPPQSRKHLKKRTVIQISDSCSKKIILVGKNSKGNYTD